MSIKDELIKIAKDKLNGSDVDPIGQVDNLLAHAATNLEFAQVIQSNDPKVQAALKEQFRYICSLHLDCAKGKKLVYVKTKNVNTAPRDKKAIWAKFPDISISYHADILIFVREGVLKNVDILHVYENYDVEYSGLRSEVPTIKNVWNMKPSERGDYSGCFVILEFPDGVIRTSYHHDEDIQATHRTFSNDRSKVWVDHKLKMTAKSAFFDSTAYLPSPSPAVDAVREAYDDSHDYTEGLLEEFQGLVGSKDGIGYFLFRQGLNEDQVNSLKDDNDNSPSPVPLRTAKELQGIGKREYDKFLADYKEDPKEEVLLDHPYFDKIIELSEKL